jgi:hypothetical protein
MAKKSKKKKGNPTKHPDRSGLGVGLSSAKDQGHEEQNASCSTPEFRVTTPRENSSPPASSSEVNQSCATPSQGHLNKRPSLLTLADLPFNTTTNSSLLSLLGGKRSPATPGSSSSVKDSMASPPDPNTFFEHNYATLALIQQYDWSSMRVISGWDEPEGERLLMELFAATTGTGLNRQHTSSLNRFMHEYRCLCIHAKELKEKLTKELADHEEDLQNFIRACKCWDEDKRQSMAEISRLEALLVPNKDNAQLNLLRKNSKLRPDILERPNGSATFENLKRAKSQKEAMSKSFHRSLSEPNSNYPNKLSHHLPLTRAWSN